MDEDVKELAKEYDLDEDTAEQAQELISYGVRELVAVEIAEEVLQLFSK